MDGYDYSYTTTSTLSDGEALAIFGFLAIFWIIILVISIITIIGQWKMFKKGNKPGWAAIIPVYNQIVQCQMIGVNPLWILISIIPLVGSIASIYFMVLLGVSTARAFGKSDGFAVGLIFLPFIFYPILGFGKASYVGMNPMNDIIFKDTNASNTNSSFCTNCGSQIPNGSKFCTNCGKQI